MIESHGLVALQEERVDHHPHLLDDVLLVDRDVLVFVHHLDDVHCGKLARTETDEEVLVVALVVGSQKGLQIFIFSDHEQNFRVVDDLAQKKATFSLISDLGKVMRPLTTV